MIHVDSSLALAAHPKGSDQAQTEAFEVLRTMARGKTGPIPADALARKALAITLGADFPVQRAAMEALLRRVAAMRRDKPKVVERRGRGGSSFRVYPEDGPPYVAELTSVDPPAGSCSCPDYAKSALGVCKHLFAVLASRRGRGAVKGGSAPEHRLAWDPIRPLTGTGDWLERVRWVDGAAARITLIEARARRWFRREGRARSVSSSFAGEPAKRRALVSDLLQLLNAQRKRRSIVSDPALDRLLSSELAALDRSLENEPIIKELPRLLRDLKHRLYPYQREGVERFLRAGRLLLADDMGLGKTIQAVAACHALLGAGRVRRGLLIVPASLKPQWIREWKDFSDAPVALVEGGPTERAEVYRKCRRGYLIANYEQLLRDLPSLQAFEPDLVVLDEAQRIKNWATKTALYVKQLQPDLRLVLTGTPMENRLDELASLMEWVDSFALEPTWRLGSWHAISAYGKAEAAGARNLDTLRARLDGRFLRRVRREVLSQLPPRTDTQIPVPLTPEQRERHDELNQPVARLLSTSHRRSLTQAEFLKLMQLLTTQRIICNGIGQLEFEQTWETLRGAARPTGPLLASLFSPKLMELRELLANVAVTQRRKVVVFSQWRRMLSLANWAVADVLAEDGVRALFFTGQEGQKRRTENLVAFHDDPSARVLFATDAGGVGLNLQRAASCCINLEVPWNPAVLEQRVGRIYRLGQTKPVEVYQLISEHGIEARIGTLVKDKKALFSGLFDGSSDQVAFERSGSFLSRVERLVEVESLPRGTDVDADAEQPGLPELADALPADAEVSPATGEVSPLPAPAAVASVTPERIGSLFGAIQIQTIAGGRVRFEAPPEAAAALAAVFQGMAQMFSSRAM